jgi:hypothetical protein
MTSTKTVLIFITVGLIIGVAISPSLVRQMREGAFTSWQPLGTPPEPITRLLGNEAGDRGRNLVRVETKSGALYQCCSQGNAEWRKVTPSELVYNNACFDLPSQATAPPRKIISCVEVAAFEGAIDRTQFALLDDGSIWMWHHHVNLLAELEIICASSAIVGLLGIGILLSMKVIQRQRQT